MQALHILVLQCVIRFSVPLSMLDDQVCEDFASWSESNYIIYYTARSRWQNINTKLLVVTMEPRGSMPQHSHSPIDSYLYKMPSKINSASMPRPFLEGIFPTYLHFKMSRTFVSSVILTTCPVHLNPLDIIHYANMHGHFLGLRSLKVSLSSWIYLHLFPLGEESIAPRAN